MGCAALRSTLGLQGLNWVSILGNTVLIADDVVDIIAWLFILIRNTLIENRTRYDT